MARTRWPNSGSDGGAPAGPERPALCRPGPRRAAPPPPPTPAQSKIAESPTLEVNICRLEWATPKTVAPTWLCPGKKASI